MYLSGSETGNGCRSGMMACKHKETKKFSMIDCFGEYEWCIDCGSWRERSDWGEDPEKWSEWNEPRYLTTTEDPIILENIKSGKPAFALIPFTAFRENANKLKEARAEARMHQNMKEQEYILMSEKLRVEQEDNKQLKNGIQQWCKRCDSYDQLPDWCDDGEINAPCNRTFACPLKEWKE